MKEKTNTCVIYEKLSEWKQFLHFLQPLCVIIFLLWLHFCILSHFEIFCININMHSEITDRRVRVPKPVFWSPKWPEYITGVCNVTTDLGFWWNFVQNGVLGVICGTKFIIFAPFSKYVDIFWKLELMAGIKNCF